MFVRLCIEDEGRGEEADEKSGAPSRAGMPPGPSTTTICAPRTSPGHRPGALGSAGTAMGRTWPLFVGQPLWPATTAATCASYHRCQRCACGEACPPGWPRWEPAFAHDLIRWAGALALQPGPELAQDYEAAVGQALPASPLHKL